ncbi:MarR family winged helix-turn-helix transcriptional regulator [Agreia sp. COWG]|uniref:MarR family winged helix-turn-helix transcriptional regulator n=1 Tax=Agreia sp. COWG TaxID=2773266 RepID=UPI001925E734|nr:MarR family transcriptional regulator [Agreia sp. COWG]CAD6001710.1 DNA-binding MarR family transcriptional regulator [Agreia sp. COWG]
MLTLDDILAEWKSERPDLDVSPMAVVGRLSRVAERVASSLSAEHARFGLDSGSVDVLFTLLRSGSPHALTPSTLARSSMVTTSVVAQRLNRLASAGLVRRDPDPDDGRGTIVTLTAEGIQVANELIEPHLRAEERFLGALDGKQRQQLCELLDLLGDRENRPGGAGILRVG